MGDDRDQHDDDQHEGQDQDRNGNEDESTESRGERANRELIELLNELRVALPGVQVLFAFLLTVPFSQRFDQLSDADRRVYMGAVLATAAATICLIAPTAQHRMRFRSGVKEHLLRAANVLTVIGLVLLAAAMSAVTYVITDMVYDSALAAAFAAGLAGLAAAIWFLLPFLYSRETTPPPDR
jgi:Family of unknown function (DUF6328)